MHVFRNLTHQIYLFLSLFGQKVDKIVVLSRGEFCPEIDKSVKLSGYPSPASEPRRWNFGQFSQISSEPRQIHQHVSFVQCKIPIAMSI